jgi:hypothetical protein
MEKRKKPATRQAFLRRHDVLSLARISLVVRSSFDSRLARCPLSLPEVFCNEMDRQVVF